MKTPVVLVALSLAMAILLSASLLIATGARGESALRGVSGQPQSWVLPGPAMKSRSSSRHPVSM